MRGGTRLWAGVLVGLLLGLLLGLPGGARADSRLYAFGDSYVNPGAGLRAHGALPWVDLLGRPVANLGHGGDTVAKTLAIVTRADRKVHGEAVVEVGINDLRKYGADPAALARFRTDYALLLRRLQGARLVVVVPPLPLSRWATHGTFRHGSDAALHLYRQVVIDLGTTTPHVVVADPLPQWDPTRMLIGDAIHPNRIGSQVIAAAVRRALAGVRP